MIAGLVRMWADIVGINRRNLDLIYPANPRARFPAVDDKIICKAVLEREGIPTPATLAVLDGQHAIAPFLRRLDNWPAFALKPANGSGGRGLRIGVRGPNGAWCDHAGRPLDRDALAFHLAAILNGEHSLGGDADRVLVEALVRDDDALLALHGATGLSDCRVIARDGRPVMAMLRLPCRGSGGAANLHAGGLGVGIDLVTGVTTTAIQGGRPIDRHPDTGKPLAGLRLPDWQTVLAISSRLNRSFAMGYLGIDFVHDHVRGALVLEVNARPGLEIQLANRLGLRAALRAAP